MLVLAISMAREAFEDYGRYKLDKAFNSQQVQVYDAKKREFVAKKSADIYVGNILLLRENERIAADVILLASDKEDGTAYIETSSLDGEKNLKAKQVAGKMDKLFPYGLNSNGAVNCLPSLHNYATC